MGYVGLHAAQERPYVGQKAQRIHHLYINEIPTGSCSSNIFLVFRAE